MGNTIPALCHTLKHIVHYILFAADRSAPWRYPRLNLMQEAHELAVDVETAMNHMEVRFKLLGDQFAMILEHVIAIGQHGWGVLYRVWRLVYHILCMVDEVGAEVVAMLISVPRVLLELCERARAQRRT